MTKASFKNISFQVPDIQHSAMRRIVRHELPRAGNADANILFYDNGKGEQLITITGFIAGRDSEETADALTKAMNDGKGTLILPFGGEPITALPEKWQINRSVNKQGMISLTIDFIILPITPRIIEAPKNKFARALDALDNATNTIDETFQKAYDVATKPIAAINSAVNRINHNAQRLQHWADFLANPLAGDFGALVTDTIGLKNAIATLTNPQSGLSASDIGTLLSGHHGYNETANVTIGKDEGDIQDALDAQFLAMLLINIGRTTTQSTTIGTPADWQNLRATLTMEFTNIATNFEQRGYYESASALRLAGNELGAAIAEAREAEAGYRKITIKTTEPLIRFCYRNYIAGGNRLSARQSPRTPDGDELFAMMADIRSRNNLTHQAIVRKGEELIIPRVRN